MTELGEFGMYAAMGAIGVFFMIAVSPVFKALARRIEGSSSQPGDGAAIEARLTALEQRGLTSGEFDNQFVRLAELEERMDFAERMLTRGDSTQPGTGIDEP